MSPMQVSATPNSLAIAVISDTWRVERLFNFDLLLRDLVRVRIGDFVPADIKIVEGTLDVDQSALTGESGTVEKSGGDGELVYSGSAVKRGEATGIVYATGTRTYFGKSVELVELARPKMHMEEITMKVARRLTIIVVASLIGAIVYALLTGFQLEVLMPLVAILLVASVPVAMPTMFTLSMALGSLTLAKKGVVVTRLSASEDAPYSLSHVFSIQYGTASVLGRLRFDVNIQRQRQVLFET